MWPAAAPAARTPAQTRSSRAWCRTEGELSGSSARSRSKRLVRTVCAGTPTIRCWRSRASTFRSLDLGRELGAQKVSERDAAAECAQGPSELEPQPRRGIRLSILEVRGEAGRGGVWKITDQDDPE